MSKSRRPGISYSRFSDFKQNKGDSADRQDRMFHVFCEQHNLTPLAEVFADRGRSGYKDEHRKKGRLGQLIAMAKDGRFEPDTVIVIEAWDRLGRLRPDRQTELVAELLRTGVSIGVCRLGDIFCEDDFGSHKWTTLAVFIQLAYQESKQKAERVAASWEKRRERARTKGELLTTRLPAWLEMVDGEPRLIPERAGVVKQIFQLAAEGQGQTRIVAALTKAGIPAFGQVHINTERTRSQFSGKWTKPYIAQILNDRRAVGELQPRKRNHDVKDEPLKNYYPAVVSEEEFALARAGQEQRNNRDKLGRKIGPRQARYVNLFKSMLIHARDGEGFLLHNKGTGKDPQLILVNATGNDGRKRCYTFPYFLFEEAILKLLREVNPRDVLPREDKTPDRVEVLRAKLVNVRQDIARLQADLKEQYAKALVAVLRDREEQEESLASELQDELAKAVRPAARAWEELPTLADLIKTAADPDDARLRLRPVLRRVLEEARLLIVRRGSYQLAAVQLFFHGGTRRDYLLAYQPAAYRRPGGWWARSLADVAAPGDLDLRKPAHVDRLEKALAEVPTTTLAMKGTCSTQ